MDASKTCGYVVELRPGAYRARVGQRPSVLQKAKVYPTLRGAETALGMVRAAGAFYPGARILPVTLRALGRHNLEDERTDP